MCWQGLQQMKVINILIDIYIYLVKWLFLNFLLLYCRQSNSITKWLNADEKCWRWLSQVPTCSGELYQEWMPLHHGSWVVPDHQVHCRPSDGTDHSKRRASQLARSLTKTLPNAGLTWGVSSRWCTQHPARDLWIFYGCPLRGTQFCAVLSSYYH